jgi:predicted  nucleic acid-binding Zn-ribbon protein
MSEMEFCSKKQGRFPSTYKKYVDPLLNVNGIIQGKNINIAICLTARKNHINVGLANQLMVFESNIIENDMCLSNEKYDIKNLQLSMSDYKFIAQFNVVSIYGDNVDIILGSTWVDTLGTFIFNTRRKFLTFSYKKKKFTLQDATMKSISEAPSSEDLKDISEVILPDNQKSIQKLQDRQEECDKIIIEKDEEICRLRNHNQKLLAKIMKSKEKKRCFQKFKQENQGLKEKLTEKEEESSCLRNLNQKLLEQIKSLKERRENLESKNKDDKSEDKEELLRLKQHNQDLLTQIKRLKHDKKSLQEKLDHKTSIIDEETMTEPMELKKSLDVKVSILDKGYRTNQPYNSKGGKSS